MLKKWNLWSGSLLAVLGLLVIIFPSFWFKVVVILLGIGAIVYGIYNLKITRSLSDGDYYHRTILIRGVVSIIIGVIAILFPLTLGKTMWFVMVWVLIVYLIVSSALGFYAAALLKDTGINRKKYILENVVLLVIAIVLILISPKNLGEAIIRIVGIVTTVIGAIIIISSFISKNKEKKAKAKVDNDNLKEAKKATAEDVKAESEKGSVEAEVIDVEVTEEKVTEEEAPKEDTVEESSEEAEEKTTDEEVKETEDKDDEDSVEEETEKKEDVEDAVVVEVEDEESEEDKK